MLSEEVMTKLTTRLTAMRNRANALASKVDDFDADDVARIGRELERDVFGMESYLSGLVDSGWTGARIITSDPEGGE